ncbi:peptide synthetase [Streptomyces cyaneogriseus subsp. noncyanogenus]|uniref:Peptide synthetase n=1 Tax=Streptomyces cyaneogriseus subsp. noncyanogenus TaxID=477245 RepID=A0A0C5GB01_9ACTN|nr:peptide synthetase [Streptomyces cyaneogriseus subsp. noncyanogenus]
MTTDNPLLRGHVVHGRHLLPGVGYVDLVLQVLARHGAVTPEVELRNLTILAPLVAEPGERVLATVEGRPAPAGGQRIEVRSRRPQDATDVLHAVVTAHPCPPAPFPERLPLPLGTADRVTTLADIYTWLRGNQLVHSGLMKSEGVVHRRGDDWLVELELAPPYHDSADSFLFHPALFEAGLLGGSVGNHMLHGGGASEGLYLPLVFESFRATARLGTRCYVRVPAGSSRRDDELMRLSVEFYDADGGKVAEVGGLVAKRVRDVSLLDVRESHAAQAPPAAAPPTAPDRSGGPDAPDVAGTVRALVAEQLKVPVTAVEAERGFYELGLVSVDLVSLVPALEDRLGLSLSPTIMFEYPSVAALTAWLEERVAERRETGPAGAVPPRPPAPPSPTDAPAPRSEAAPSTTTAPDVLGALLDETAALLKVPAAEIDPDGEFTEFGLDWAALARLSARLGDRYGPALTPALLSDRRTVRAVAEHIAAAASGPATGTGASGTRPEPEPTHPMLHHAEPDGDGLLFRTRFDGTEPFLRDHRVRDARVLPAVAQLEMARTAVERLLGEGHRGRVRLDDVVWLRPATCGPDGLELSLRVRPLPGQGWEYEIHSVTGDGEPALCSQGRASLTEEGERPPVDLAGLRARCAEHTVAAGAVYELYARAGMDYGPAQQSLAELRVGADEDGRPQVLAELRLPGAAAGLDGCLLHPSLVDGALQATIGLRLPARPDGERQARPALPFAVRHVDAVAATPSTAYVWVRHRPGGGRDAATAPLDVTVVDATGRVCAELTGLNTRALADAPEAQAPAPPEVRGAARPREEVPAAFTPGTGDIAVIGVSGRYPQAADLDAFWRNLREGRDCIREVPPERWDHRRYADAGGSSSGAWGGFLDEIDRFDPLFFQISLHEAELLDPQERLFLQCAHHTLEDAGYAAGPGGKVGVFVGVMYEEYQLYGAQAQYAGRPVALSGSAASIANRVSYFYDFTGPSMTVDTMCSSSLTAIHLACEAIKSGQCETALAGGVNLHSHPNKFLMLSQRRFLSSDGRCRSFGEGGDGYVPGEGVGAVLLKPLERAVADGDHIHGVIKGTALNHGGRTSGYSVPSPAAQAAVITEALTGAGVDPRRLSYLEAHGTGTALGDPIEIAGLKKALHSLGSVPQDLPIGSVKSNIGHAEGAAGIAGVTKVLLQMRHGELAPSLHSATPNPHLALDGTPVRVQQRLEPWHRPVLEADGVRRAVPRIAGVSGFGAGGSNAHVVIAEYEPPAGPPAPPAAPRRTALLVLSARSEEQLVEQSRRLRTRLAELPDDALPDVAWTLQTGRMALEERLALAVTSMADARARLAAFADAPRQPGAWTRGTARRGRDASAGTEAAEVRTAAAEWTGHGTPDRLLRLWADGAAVDWATLDPSAAPVRRVSLPGYPFARERCWFDLEPRDASAAPLSPASAPGAAPPATAEDTGRRDEMILLRPTWTVEEDTPAGEAPAGTFAAHHVVLVGRLTDPERDAVRAALPDGVTCHAADLADGPLERQYTETAQRVLALVRRILADGPRRPVLLQVALVGDAPSGTERERLACFGALAGLLRTASLENPLLHTQYVESLDGASPATVAARLRADAVPGPEPEVRHRDGRRQVGRWEETAPGLAAAAPWRDGGVYLITGGAGGLGLIVAGDIAASVRHATVVLTGRSPLSDDRRRRLEELRAAGLTVDHQRADVGDRESVARVLAHVADRYGPLTGIVHSAGVTDDGLLLRKTPETLARVLAPKVAGLVNLDELTREQPLETFVCFSSIAAAFGNPGQADYAAANAFMDAYAVYRNRLVEAGLRHGRTVSVDWPLWDEGGMGGDTVRENLRAAGLGTLDTPRGLRALRQALAPADGPADGRLLVAVGRRETLPARLFGNAVRASGPADGTPAAAAAADPGRPGVTGAAAADSEQPATLAAAAAPDPEHPGATDAGTARALEERAVGHLRRLLASSLKLGPERLAPDTPLEQYGMDSVIAVHAVTRLEESFGPLSRTLLFEFPTIRDLAEYFVSDHPQALRTLLGEPTAPLPVPATPAAPADPAGAPPPGDTASAPGSGPAVAARDRAAGPGTHRAGGDGDIAVIAVSGRYPQAADLDELWANLRDGKDCVTEVPADRWDPGTADAATDAGEGARSRAWGGFLDGIDRFDPLHFGISPREAAAMDPQLRLFLETVWHLLEESGTTQEVIERRYGRSVGVYVGAAYHLYRADDTDPALAALTSAASYNMIANRVSHFFGLEGPSLAVDGMCASSALAIHLACADLRRGETELAVAGGVNLTVHPDKYLALDELRLLGSHPGSRSFRDGDGYLPAEAVGAVLLKPLEAAVRDGDRILAVVKGTASVHSGRSNGFMMPSHRAQTKAMRRALEQAAVTADSIGYVEAAAGGTTLSDAVEFRALREVFDGVTEPVALGSVKSNLGHPEAASGIAQLTKVVLQLRHGQLAPLVEVGAPNPDLDFDGTALTLCDRLTDWAPRGADGAGGAPAPRRALINSVAAGGSHVSLVVEAPPRTGTATEGAPDNGPQVVVVSARNARRLRTAVRRLHDFLERDGSVTLADVAYGSQLGREALPERLAVVARSLDELKAALAHHLADDPGTDDAPAAVTVHRGNAEEDAGPLGTVLSGLRGEQFVAGLVADRDLDHLAELWVRGVTVPWGGLHAGRRPLVPLPPTEFERGSYWVGRRPGPARPTAAGTAPTDTAAPAGPERAGHGEEAEHAERTELPERAGRLRDRALTDTERTVVAAWSELLEIDTGELDAASNFLSLGGNSLLATRLINLLERHTGVHLPVQAVFDAPRVAELARELERRRPSVPTGSPDTEQILKSIALIEDMSDEELDALLVENVEN